MSGTIKSVNRFQRLYSKERLTLFAYYHYNYLKSYYCAILTMIITINIPQITQQPLCIRFPVYRMLCSQGIPMHCTNSLESVEYIQGYTNNNYIIVHFGAPIDSWCLIHILIPPFKSWLQA